MAVPNDKDVVEAPTFPNDENGVLVVGLMLVVPKLPKLAVVAVAVDDAGQPPKDDPKPNCGLLKFIFNVFIIFKKVADIITENLTRFKLF